MKSGDQNGTVLIAKIRVSRIFQSIMSAFHPPPPKKDDLHTQWHTFGSQRPAPEL
jgi:hypothetical protein